MGIDAKNSLVIFIYNLATAYYVKATSLKKHVIIAKERWRREIERIKKTKKEKKDFDESPDNCYF